MAFPETGILDTFNRTDENPVTGWTDVSSGFGGMRVVSNQMTGEAATYCHAYWNHSFSVPFENYITIANNIGGGEVVEIYWLLSDNGSASPITDSAKNGYRLLTHLPGANQVRIDRMDNNSATVLNSFSWTIANGDSFGVSVTGTTHTIYGKASAGSWTQIGTVSDGTYTSGKFMVNTGAPGTTQFDQFGGGSINNASYFLLLGVS